MTKRRDRLKELLSGSDVAKEEVSPSKAESSPTPTTTKPETTKTKHRSSGAIRAMGLSLDGLKEEIATEQTGGIHRLDPSLIDPALVSDRLSSGAIHDPQFERLKESIENGGQQVPVLVRPHPDLTKREAGQYQAAYGHRRIRAAAELGLSVDAIIREMSDDELVLAQGKENAERRDLSFIERAFFAKGLLDHGFDRATAQVALSVHKSEMTRLLQVADSIPIRFAQAIGPAPKVGRPRWVALGELLSKKANIEKASDETGKAIFDEASSDERFQLVFSRVSKPLKKEKPQLLKTSDGRLLAEKKGRVVKLDKSLPDEFADYLVEELPNLLVKFESKGN